MMPASSDTFLRTPLYDKHVALDARMVEFAGWEMPLQYEGILAEHRAAREKAALFDTSHMGEFFISGDAAAGGLDRIVTCPIVDMPVKTCRYGAMLNPSGGIIDDLTVYRLAKEKWMVVVNAVDIRRKAEHFRKHLTARQAFQDVSSQTGKLDIQGPLARDILKEEAGGIETLAYFGFDHFPLLGEETLISRTGYTGELGYEIYLPAEKSGQLWERLLRHEAVRPAGLGVRDVLRLEMGYSLYGNDLDETTTPLEAGLSPFVDFDKDFIGKEALLRQKEEGVPRKLVAFISENKRSPRPHYRLYSSDPDQEIGEVSSGIFSPALGRGIGMGYIRRGSARRGDKVLFGNGRTRVAAQITRRPFYRNGSVKS